MKKIILLIIGAAIVIAVVAIARRVDSSNNVGGPSGTLSATNETKLSTTTEAPLSDGTDVSPIGGTPITITAGGRTITATLNDSDVAQDFAALLPVTLPWFRNFDVGYMTELGAPLTETGPFYTDVRAGDIVYYNPRDSVAIIYKPTTSVPTLTKMGEIISDLSVFEEFPQNVEMLIELSPR
jgi:hypothetical protein